MPDVAQRRRPWEWGITFLLAACGAAYSVWLRPAPDPRAPVAIWRDGRVQAIRHCENPTEATALLACASLHCQAAVAAQLTEPGRTRIGAATRVPDSGARYLRFVGVIESEASRAPALPRGYECHVEGLTVSSVRLIN